MRGLLFLLLATVGLILILQNPQQMTLLVGGATSASARFQLTLPIGIWVVAFTGLGLVTSGLINGLSRVGKSPTPRAQAPSVPPSPPRSPRRRSPVEPTPPNDNGPEFVGFPPEIEEESWDWDDPIPEVADWDDPAPTPPRSKPLATKNQRRPSVTQVRDQGSSPSPVQSSSYQTPSANPVSNEETPEGPSTQDQQINDQAVQEAINSPPVSDQTAQQPRQPLPDLRQFEVTQKPTQTTRQGTIYSHQYRPTRKNTPQPTAKTDPDKPKSPPPPSPPKLSGTNPSRDVYDADYRVLTPPFKGEPEAPEDWEDEEDWI